MAENWAIVMSDAELLKSGAGEKVANLVVYAASGAIPGYESRISKILNSPTLKTSLDSAIAEANLLKPEKKSKTKESQGPGNESIDEPQKTATTLPDIPGFGSSASGGSSGSGSPASTIPGFGPGPGSTPAPPTNIPGFGTSPGSSGTNQKPPWQKD
jgi:hypothetical protein